MLALFGVAVVGFLHCNELTGDTSFDYGTAYDHATLRNGASRVPGKFGNGLSLDGIDDFVSVANNNYFNAPVTFSMEFWLLSDSADLFPLIPMSTKPLDGSWSDDSLLQSSTKLLRLKFVCWQSFTQGGILLDGDQGSNFAVSLIE